MRALARRTTTALQSILSTSHTRPVPFVCLSCRLRQDAIRRSHSAHSTDGPLAAYDARVQRGLIRDDEHQRGIVSRLQHLHDELREYSPPPVQHPQLGAVRRRSLFMRWMGYGGADRTSGVPHAQPNLPKGLYLYGDVGSGKTMLMDLFYDTLPPSRTLTKTRIHFHNFMQDVHRRIHHFKLEHSAFDVDGVPFVAADIAQDGRVLCFDEFQCTDVADAMILRRLLSSLMGHGVVMVTTSNRHPDQLYINGIQRESFIPCITLLQTRLHVLALDSPTDYRKIPRPPSGVYHWPLDRAASSHADKWFRFLGDPEHDPPHPSSVRIWGRDVTVPSASGRAARFSFADLIQRPTGAADYLELVRAYDAFVVTDVPGMTFRERDLARRFITFVDAVYESRAKLVLTTAVPIPQLFMSKEELQESAESGSNDPGPTDAVLADDLGLSLAAMQNSSLFSGDEEKFAFARALSRLSEMAGQEWVERGLGLEGKGGKQEKESWMRVRSRWREDTG